MIERQAKLNRCPFCGGEADLKYDFDNAEYFVECTKCHIRTTGCLSLRLDPSEELIEELERRWNKRTHDKKQLIDRLMEKIRCELLVENDDYLERHNEAYIEGWCEAYETVECVCAEMRDEDDG